MFILKSKIDNYLQKKHDKAIAKLKKNHQDYINRLEMKHEYEIIDIKNEYQRKLKRKNREILQLKKQRELYIDKSLEYDINIERIENLRYKIISTLGDLTHDCDEVLHSDMMNSMFIYKNEHRIRKDRR